MEAKYVDRYYMTEVDAFEDSIYCHHKVMGESFIAEHMHQKGQFLYTEGGVVFLKTPDKSFFLPARHYIWIPSGMKHSIHPSSPEVIMRNLYFPKFETDTDFFDKINIYPVNDLLIELIMFTNRWNGNIFPVEEPKYSIAKAFKLILPELSQTELPLALPYPSHTKLKDIITYLDSRIEENVSFKDVAKQFDISERTLARLFQKELNMSFIQYYTILRMLKALKLLLDEKLTVNEVALKVGYSSLPTFSNTFNKIVGVRPSEYVKHKNHLL
ncbi:transcriptional regulator, AraC family [Sphingobacterium spiritivorum ATCC 33300]|uniref:L-rhamnose operon regulatory protein rhaS n=2 Tax=Sphingobacterium spiritivorum TaxID=258 RepID=A0A380CAA5_SPHSI|nr:MULTISPECIES: AraC family transcriptional regulator [Sphingobacterium]EEI93950.1 transcriptional regulator, AraC family [Sphingobacterium spiritivorum ATCC 33300]QQS94249.1 helix-turn-helix domain-containing protein [Sphingobacterium spiritivorum]QQT27018.1 helix-turn-helix domain-containing protein [Sphingobacterium spiritivorum]SUJ16392.1 L-rhamnose operon regulatory protein rhaS [Sphingobacterium spiritivorum]